MTRILKVLPRLRRRGPQAMFMSLYRIFNSEKHQFDFIIFTPDQDDNYDEIYEFDGQENSSIYIMSGAPNTVLSFIARGE